MSLIQSFNPRKKTKIPQERMKSVSRPCFELKHQRVWTEIKWIAQGHTLCQGRLRVRTHSPQVSNLLLGSLNHKCLSRKKVSLELRQHSWRILTPKFKIDRISLDHRSITSFGGYTGEARGQGGGGGMAENGWENREAGGEADDRGWDGWMASPTQWTWVWVNSGSWWWAGRPGVLQSIGSLRVGHDWATELTDWLKEDDKIIPHQQATTLQTHTHCWLT